jgi:Protein of unknown function (DUF2877)
MSVLTPPPPRQRSTGPPSPGFRPAVTPASGPAWVQSLISGPTCPADLIAAFPTAAYLRLYDGRVIAVLTHDAVRLPCGLVLAATSVEQPLTGVHGPVLAGEGQVRIGALAVEIARVVSATAPLELVPDATAVGRAGRRLEHLGFNEHGPALAERLAAHCRNPQDVPGLVRLLLGSGSGLTPSGDDVLAGFLVGSRSFSVCSGELRVAVMAHAPGATTDLSATLLSHAARGESIPQVGSLLRALAAGPAGSRIDESLATLVRVGHSSGIALATGIHAAAKASLELRRRDVNKRTACCVSECCGRTAAPIAQR